MNTNKQNRELIFKSVSAALDSAGSKTERDKNANARINALARGPVPRPRNNKNNTVEEFVAEATRADAEIIRLTSTNEIPSAVMGAVNKDGAVIRVAPHPVLKSLTWPQGSAEIKYGAAAPSDYAGVSLVKAGVAETGTLVLLSGLDSPVTINFLPDVHVVVLFADDIVPHYEDAWDMMRSDAGAGKSINMPRTVNWITGPSRTADIEQSILLGAHGPRRLVILLIDGKKT